MNIRVLGCNVACIYLTLHASIPLHPHTHTHTHTRTHARTHAHTHTHARTHACTHSHARTHAHARAHTHTHTRTHIKRERQTETDTETDRDRDIGRQTDRETESQTDRQMDRLNHRNRNREPEKMWPHQGWIFFSSLARISRLGTEAVLAWYERLHGSQCRLCHRINTSHTLRSWSDGIGWVGCYVSMLASSSQSALSEDEERDGCHMSGPGNTVEERL